jgi:hypothetical protein
MQAAKRGDDVTFDLDVAGDISATEAELARSPKDASQRVGRADVDGAHTVVRADGTAVP